MRRPQSIVLFERVFALIVLTSVAASLYAMAVGMPMLPPGVPSRLVRAMPWLMAGGLVVTLAINALLWLFIARYGSNLGRWLFVFLFLLAIFGLLRQQSDDMLLPAHLWIFSAFGLLLQAIAVWLLFRPDTRDWFRH